MALNGLSPQELTTALVNLIKQMVDRGLLPGLKVGEEKALAEQVAKTLTDDKNITLYRADITNNAIRDTLAVACMSQNMMNLKPDFKFQYTLLLNPQTDANKQQLKEELKLLLKLKFLEMPEMKAKFDRDPQKLNNILDVVVDKIVDKDLKDANRESCFFENHTLLQKSAGLLDMVIDPLREDRIARYNIDTHNPGSISHPVLGNPTGNAMGALDLEPNPTYSFEGRAGNPDPGQPDPMGTIFQTILNFIGANYDSPQLEQDMIDNGCLPGPEKSPSPFRNPLSTEYKPPGAQ